jgi:hypothetical protein
MMMTNNSLSPLERRSFLSRLGLGIAAFGTAATALPGRVQAAAAARWQPSTHALDDWFEAPSAKHRIVFDSTTPLAAGAALAYANNFVTANKTGYNLEPSDLAIVIIYRHFATPFAYNDAIWAKYGPGLSEALEFSDPKTKQPLSRNIYTAGDYGFALPNFGTTLDKIIQQGGRFAVCDMATHFIAGLIADKTKGDANAIYRELTQNLIPNARLVPAGIVAVNRAQERGYAFSYVT